MKTQRAVFYNTKALSDKEIEFYFNKCLEFGWNLPYLHVGKDSKYFKEVKHDALSKKLFWMFMEYKTMNFLNEGLVPLYRKPHLQHTRFMDLSKKRNLRRLKNIIEKGLPAEYE